MQIVCKAKRRIYNIHNTHMRDRVCAIERWLDDWLNACAFESDRHSTRVNE